MSTSVNPKSAREDIFFHLFFVTLQMKINVILESGTFLCHVYHSLVVTRSTDFRLWLWEGLSGNHMQEEMEYLYPVADPVADREGARGYSYLTKE